MATEPEPARKETEPACTEPARVQERKETGLEPARKEMVRVCTETEPACTETARVQERKEPVTVRKEPVTVCTEMEPVTGACTETVQGKARTEMEPVTGACTEMEPGKARTEMELVTVCTETEQGKARTETEMGLAPEQGKEQGPGQAMVSAPGKARDNRRVARLGRGKAEPQAGMQE
jgi:hypothetical protein